VPQYPVEVFQNKKVPPEAVIKCEKITEFYDESA
jgi:hypothetical protein